MTYKKDFELYKEWCKENNLKPGYATSLEAYMKIKKLKDKNLEMELFD